MTSFSEENLFPEITRRGDMRLVGVDPQGFPVKP